MSRRELEPSEFLAMVQFTYRDDLALLRGKQPKFRCFDCKRWIPIDELPMRCEECSGPNLRGEKVGYRRKLITQDAMVCKHCVDRHPHLREAVVSFQLEALRHGLEKRATMRAMGQYAKGEAVS